MVKLLSFAATSSINRGGVFALAKDGEYFNSPSIYKGSTAKPGGSLNVELNE